MDMNEIIFLVKEAHTGGFEAKGLSAPIFTEADSLEELRGNVRDAVKCHFDVEARPQVIRLHFVREEILAASDRAHSI